MPLVSRTRCNKSGRALDRNFASVYVGQAAQDGTSHWRHHKGCSRHNKADQVASRHTKSRQSPTFRFKSPDSKSSNQFFPLRLPGLLGSGSEFVARSRRRGRDRPGRSSPGSLGSRCFRPRCLGPSRRSLRSIGLSCFSLQRSHSFHRGLRGVESGGIGFCLRSLHRFGLSCLGLQCFSSCRGGLVGLDLRCFRVCCRIDLIGLTYFTVGRMGPGGLRLSCLRCLAGRRTRRRQSGRYRRWNGGQQADLGRRGCCRDRRFRCMR